VPTSTAVSIGAADTGDGGVIGGGGVGAEEGQGHKDESTLLDWVPLIIPSYHHTIIPSYQTIMPACQHTIITYHTITPSYHHTIIPSYHHIRPSCHHTIIPYHHTIILSYHHTIILSYHHTSTPIGIVIPALQHHDVCRHYLYAQQTNITHVPH
jgi:hypothetical protein